MSRFVVLLVLGMALGLAMSECAPRVRGPVKVMERDSGCMIELRPGEKMEVILEANPSTGYLWQIASPDITVVKQDGEPQFTPDNKAIGGGGKITFRFEAVAAGEQLLRLVYHRPFEEGVPPLKTFEVDVLVR